MGSGNMGSAILEGLLQTPKSESMISRFIVTTKSEESANRLRSRFKANASRITFMHGQNTQAIQQADVIMLAFKPYMVGEILPNIADGLGEKTVISVLAGITLRDLREYTRPRVFFRAMPNLATGICQSMTIIEKPEPSDCDKVTLNVVTWIFEQLGAVKLLPSDQFDAGVMAMGSSIGLMLVTLEGILDGCVAEGLKRSDALELASQAMAGTAGLLKNGTQPAALREEIASPRGCTIQTLLRAEREGVRGSCAQAVIDGAEHLRK